MEAIKKLRDKKIFNDQSIVESMIQKNWMGSPVIKRSLLRVKQVGENECMCEELGSADGKAYSLNEFVEAYGGSLEKPPEEWQTAAPLADVPESDDANSAAPEVSDGVSDHGDWQQDDWGQDAFDEVDFAVGIECRGA